jgi:repressor LexA
MKDAGIMEGDLVIVERREKAKEGSIVIAELDGEWTIKYLRKDKTGAQYLEPANEKYPDLYPKESLRVVAVVVGVIRKYR